MPPPFGPPPTTPGGPLPPRPALPGNPMGGPAGPGASPMTAPGAGAGNEAATDALIAALMPALYKALQSYQLGSKKNQAVLNAIRALTPTFGKQEGQQMVPAAIQQLAMNAKGGGPMAGAPVPPLSPAPPPGVGAGGPPGGAPEPGEPMAA